MREKPGPIEKRNPKDLPDDPKLEQAKRAQRKKNLAQQDQQGNTKQNTTHQGLRQAR